MTGAQCFLSPAPGPFATYSENGTFPHEEYMRATNGSLSVVPDPPACPTLQRPIEMAPASYDNLRPPCIPELEYSPLEYRRLYLGAFLVESAPLAVGSGTHSGSGMHPRWGGLLNGPDSEQLRGFSESNTIGPSEDVSVPFVHPFAGQATSYQPSSGIGAWGEIHPPTHVPGRGKYGLYRIGERGEEVALSNGESMNRAE